jgi:hypothetical protein
MKKIYDIIPPDKVEDILKPKEKVIKEKKKRKFPFKIFLIILIGALVYGFFMEGRAEVIIYPKLEVLSEEVIINVNLKQGAVDLENKVIPAIVFEKESDFSEEYQATGITEKDKKAKGTIRVFNKQNPGKPLTLIKGTRFLNETGELIYRALSGFTVPQAKTVDGKFTPGYVDVEVEADTAGEKYNINSGTFSVPGLSGTEYYSSIWAQVINSISGGFKSEVSVVLSKDIEGAKNNFEEKFSSKNQEDLKNSIPSNYILSEDGFLTNFEDVVTSAKAGEEVSSFTVSGKAKTEIQAFRKDDIESILENIIAQKTTEIIVPDSLELNVTETKEKTDGAEIKISFEVKTYWLPENAFLLQNILGKEKNFSATLLNGIPEIEKSEIKLSPFWKTNNPNNKEKVEIKLNFDQ